jgi:hypothetical protein
VALIGIVLWAYDEINNLNPFRRATAITNAFHVLHLELRLHLDPELPLNHWLANHLTLGRVLGDYYDTAHFVVSLAVLFWVWWRHPARYRFFRNALLGINVVGFAVFWAFPVAPPRMLVSAGFIDIVAVAHSVGAWSSGTLASQANEYAAMPSLHVAWALWCAAVLWVLRKDIASRVVAAAYAVATGFVVLATANHYFLDVVAGAVAAVASGAGALMIERRQAYRWAARKRPISPSEVRVSMRRWSAANSENMASTLTTVRSVSDQSR